MKNGRRTSERTGKQYKEEGKEREKDKERKDGGRRWEREGMLF